MDTTRVLLFLFVVSSCRCCNARDLSSNPVARKSEIVTVVQPRDHPLEGGDQLVREVRKDVRVCALCEDFAGQALNYLSESENKTQTEIIETLHKSCSKIPSFKKQCIVLVDYYAPLFFLEVSSIEAGEFCRKVDLCEEGEGLSISQDKCDICQNVVKEALLKLKDPDTELEIIQLLLEACDSVGKSVKKCNRLVFEYAPIVLVNAEEFLETNDVCTILHACDSTETSSMHATS